MLPKLLAVFLLAVAPLAAQTPPPAPAYDIVSVKLNETGSGSWDLDSHDGRFSTKNISLKDLLVSAFDVRPYLITGIPKAFDSARFDIEAKIVEPDLPALRKLTQDQERALVLPILTDRFQLKTHTETKTLPVYELVVLPWAQSSRRTPATVPTATCPSATVSSRQARCRWSTWRRCCPRTSSAPSSTRPVSSPTTI